MLGAELRPWRAWWTTRGAALDQTAGNVIGERRVERRVAAIVEDVEAPDAQPLVVRHPLRHVFRLILHRRL